MARRTTLRLPVETRYRCVMMDRKGKVCEREIDYKVTRTDGSVFHLCSTCAVKLHDLHGNHPDIFPPLRFSAISKLEETS